MTAPGPVDSSSPCLERFAPFASQMDGCELLLTRHLAAALQRFGSAALDLIDLPPLTPGGGQLSADQIRAAAVLYWSSQVEQAGIPAFAEGLAAGMVQGRLMFPFVTGGDRLMVYWRARHERLEPGERSAIYQRLFGGAAASHPFPPLMSALCQALADIGHAGRQEALAPLWARVTSHARDLGALLTEEAVGITAFAGRDILANIRTAVALLRDRDISVTLGAVSVGIWRMIRRHSLLVLGRVILPDAPLARAASGLEILSWLADHAAKLDGGRVRLDAKAPVVQAALQWQQAVEA